MPFPFVLPTTSHLDFSKYLSSSTHPSLPATATTYRALLHDVLKRHKRAPPPSREPHLPNVLSALNEYVPYLAALDSGLSNRLLPSELVDVTLLAEPTARWRSTLSRTLPGRSLPRHTIVSLDDEFFFTLTTLAYTYTLLARVELRVLYEAQTPTLERRTAAVSSAVRHLLEAHGIQAYLAARAQSSATVNQVVDISAPVLGALASISLAEATLLAVLKDDPYAAAVTQDRNVEDKDWMVKAPSIPKIRVHLFARVCLAAAEHASKASAQLDQTKEVDEALVLYAEDLKRAARAKACRFLGIDKEAEGEVGDAIAWCRAGKYELGFLKIGTNEKVGALARLKRGFQEKREDRKLAKGGEWGTDAGRLEEARIIEILEKKWTKMNETVSYQRVPPFDKMPGQLPSGREYHTPKPFSPAQLEESRLARLRNPLRASDAVFTGGDEDDDDDDDSSDDDRRGLQPAANPVGAFPGTANSYY